jgi:hypothetical protein
VPRARVGKRKRDLSATQLRTANLKGSISVLHIHMSLDRRADIHPFPIDLL